VIDPSVAQSAREPRPDDQGTLEPPHGCIDGVVYVGHMVEGEDGEEVEVVEAVPCRRCDEGAPAREVHHAAPRCLLRLWDAASGSLPDPGVSPAWLEWTDEAGRWGVPVEIDRGDLAELVARSTEVLDRERHRLIHESDFARWGRRGGLATVRRYGRSWMALLALRRWGRIDKANLEAARPLR